jgi:hypothetical protein
MQDRSYEESYSFTLSLNYFIAHAFRIDEEEVIGLDPESDSTGLLMPIWPQRLQLDWAPPSASLTPDQRERIGRAVFGMDPPRRKGTT